jgi:hypothetical protein
MEFKTYDSLEDMFSAMEMYRQRADQSVQPFQAKAKPGDHYLQESAFGFSIYGKILDDPEPRPPRLENYRFVEAYSVACPKGELGDLHVASIDRIITYDEFLYAKACGWQE